MRAVFFVTILTTAVSCTPTHDILVVGVLHRGHTEPSHRADVEPLKTVIATFNPQVFCVEYPTPADTFSWKLLYPYRFDHLRSERREWNVETSLQKIDQLKLQVSDDSTDVGLKLKLIEQYHLLNDEPNAEYQSYKLFSAMGPKIDPDLIKKYPGYEEFLESYRHHDMSASEFFLLVFPVAKSLRIEYLFPIDDFSSWAEFEKYENLLKQSTDPTALFYKALSSRLHHQLDSIVLTNGNKWLFVNSRELQRELRVLEKYDITAEHLENDNARKLHEFWVERNAAMTRNIVKTAQQQGSRRIVVFAGASHVETLKDELKKIDRRSRIVTVADLLKPAKPVNNRVRSLRRFVSN